MPSENGVLDAIRLIPPEKLRALTGRPNLYATPAAVIAERCALTAEESEQLRNALELWREKRLPLAESLPPGLAGKLEMNFSTRESGAYTIQADASSPENPGRAPQSDRPPGDGEPQFRVLRILLFLTMGMKK